MYTGFMQNANLSTTTNASIVELSEVQKH